MNRAGAFDLRSLPLAACLLSLLVASPGCGDEPAPEAPLGTFVLDTEAMTAALVAGGVPEKAARRKTRAAGVRLVFDAAGTFALVVRDEAGRVERWSGHFSRDGDAITLRTERRGAVVRSPPDLVHARLEGGRLRVRPPGSARMPFVLRRE